MVNIVSRAQWGAKPWATDVFTVPFFVRTEFLVHYHGGIPPVAIGPRVPQDCEAIHLANGWAGIGYNFVVDQAGTAYEGRGWSLVGAHCPNHNRTGLGVYVAVGGSQVATPAALATVRALYDEGCRLTGTALRKTWHGANYATECPGQYLIDWVKNGMVAPSSLEKNLSLSQEDIDRIADDIESAKARYLVHDVDPSGKPELIAVPTALERILGLLRNARN